MTNNLYTPTKEQINKYKPIIEEYLTRIKTVTDEETDKDFRTMDDEQLYKKYVLDLTGEQINPKQLCEILRILGWELIDSDYNSNDYFQNLQKEDEESCISNLIIQSNNDTFELILQTNELC